MLKNIQKYLLIHHPLIWNVRFIPMLAILIVLHLIFFAVGYAVTNTSFSKIFGYGDELPLLYFVSILIDVLLLVGWLVFYNRNNGFKSFYPRKTAQLYLEWVMVFIIVAGMALVPVSLTCGHLTKWKSVASLQEAKEAESLLEKVNLLIARDSEQYKYNSEYQKPVPIPEGMEFQGDTLSRSLYSFDYDWSNNKMHVEGYIGASFLFYREYYYSHYTRKDLEVIDSPEKRRFLNEESVKEMLRNSKRDSIFAIMTEFEKLRIKHHLLSDISPEKWLDRIYNPPFFPVDGSTAIMNREDDADQYTSIWFDGIASEEQVVDPQVHTSEVLPYLPYRNLESGYNQVLRCYDFGETFRTIILISLCAAIFVSCLIFSFRFSKGKFWLISFIATGILIFITILLAVTFHEFLDWNSEMVVLFILSVWIALFVILLTKVILKVNSKSHKGRSETYLNLLVWMAPCIIPLSFFFYLVCVDLSDRSYYHKDDEIVAMFWINIPVVILGMWFFAVLIRKWKSLGDQ